MDLDLIISFFLSMGIGAVMGLEREIVQQKKKEESFAGIRTFILIAIFGFILTYFSFHILNSSAAFIVGFAAFMLLIVSAYALLSIKTKGYGATTEIAAIITFLLAAIVTFDKTRAMHLLAVIIAVIVASFLALKENLHKFAKNIQISEVYATIKMAAISIIILPLLPNKNYTLLEIPLLNNLILAFPKIVPMIQQLDVFNPFKIWLMVVLISGISFVGYVLIKTVGANKGIGFTSFLGGIVSSTAVTVALAEKSKGKNTTSPFVFGIILASAVMFIRVLLVVSAINPSMISLLIIPLLSMAFTAVLAALFISKLNKNEPMENIDFKTPFAIWPAIKFGIFFMFILVASKLLFVLFGNSGVYISSFLSGFADVDAIVLTLGTLSFSGVLAAKVAVLGITIAVCVNTLLKAGIVYWMGSKKVAKYLLLIILLILAVGIGAAFLVS